MRRRERRSGKQREGADVRGPSFHAQELARGESPTRVRDETLPFRGPPEVREGCIAGLAGPGVSRVGAFGAAPSLGSAWRRSGEKLAMPRGVRQRILRGDAGLLRRRRRPSARRAGPARAAGVVAAQRRSADRRQADPRGGAAVVLDRREPAGRRLGWVGPYAARPWGRGGEPRASRGAPRCARTAAAGYFFAAPRPPPKFTSLNPALRTTSAVIAASL